MTENKQQSLSEQARRRFLHQLAAVGGIAGGVAAGAAALTAIALETAAGNDAGNNEDNDAETTPASQANASTRWGMLIDAAKCSDGCDACVRACDEEHGLHHSRTPEIDARWIRKVQITNPKTRKTQSFPVMCQHCESAPCVDVCPTGASFRRADGIVLVNKHTCIGCRYCMMACPFGARSFIHENLTQQLPDAPRGKGTVESCTLCVHRIDRDEAAAPACVQACQSEGHQAMMFGDLNETTSDLTQAVAATATTVIRGDLELGAAIRYANLAATP